MLHCSTSSMEQRRCPQRVLSHAKIRNIVLVPGSDVELIDGDFVRVIQILRDRTKRETIVRGLLLRRNTDHQLHHLQNMLPRALNELHIVLRGIDPERGNPKLDDRSKLDDYLFDYPLEWIKNLREIIFTNRPSSHPASGCGAKQFPDFSYRDNLRPEYIMVNGCGERVIDQKFVREHAVLVARWKSLQYTGKQGDNAYAGALIRFSEHESDAGKGIYDAALVYWFRELAMYGRAPTASPPPHLHTLNASERTYCDICAGAGGVAAGVTMAKDNNQTFKIAFCLDHCPAACETLRLNFPEATILQTSIHDWCTEKDAKDYRVVVAHISYPCTFWSWAHTVEGRNDIANSDTAWATKAVLSKLRARHVTFEQTDAIIAMRVKHKGVFSALIQELTSMQYSVRWKIVDAAEHGNAQRQRKRLIIFASAPGEPLADFAPPRPGPRIVVGDVLRDTIREVEPHMQATMPMHGLPHDATQPLPNLITCKASPGTHPDGNRGYNMQQTAQLAGFPWWHRFADVCKTKLMELIGNAVPSTMIKDEYVMIHRSLDEGDAAMQAWLATRDNGPIVLDDDNDVEMLADELECIVLDGDDDVEMLAVEHELIVID